MQAHMQQAIVRSLPEEDKLEIAILLAGRERFMKRPKLESLEKTLARLQKNASDGPGMHFSDGSCFLLHGFNEVSVCSLGPVLVFWGQSSRAVLSRCCTDIGHNIGHSRQWLRFIICD
jgi:hypothetical protein